LTNEIERVSGTYLLRVLNMTPLHCSNLFWLLCNWHRGLRRWKWWNNRHQRLKKSPKQLLVTLQAQYVPASTLASTNRIAYKEINNL
jgi:hypothetical protein